MPMTSPMTFRSLSRRHSSSTYPEPPAYLTSTRYSPPGAPHTAICDTATSATPGAMLKLLNSTEPVSLSTYTSTR